MQLARQHQASCAAGKPRARRRGFLDEIPGARRKRGSEMESVSPGEAPKRVLVHAYHSARGRGLEARREIGDERRAAP